MNKYFKQKTLRIVIKGDGVFLDNHCFKGGGLVKSSYVDKKHLLYKIKELIDFDYNDIIDTPKKRKERRDYKKWIDEIRRKSWKPEK